MKKTLTLTLCALIAGIAAWAAPVQTVTVNEEEISGKAVEQILFDCEKVTVVFDDGSTIDDVNTLKLLIGASGVSGAKFYEASVKVEGNSLTVKGLDGGNAISVFDAKGQQVATAQLQSEVASIDISNLSAGIYFVRSGKQVIKFLKK